MTEDRTIRTIPGEARPYQGLRAGLVTRIGANVADLLVVVVTLVGIYLGWSAVLFLLDGRSFAFPTPGFAVAYVVGAVVLLVYFTAAWTTTGRTYGNHLLGLRVVNRRGDRMRVPGAFLRAAVCVLFPVGLLWCAVSRGNRSIQDLILGTSVIYDWDVRPRGQTEA